MARNLRPFARKVERYIDALSLKKAAADGQLSDLVKQKNLELANKFLESDGLLSVPRGHRTASDAELGTHHRKPEPHP